MAGNTDINIPLDLFPLVKISNNEEQLRNFLLQIVDTLNDLTRRIEILEEENGS